jgi:CheY-like chemotaxis protein
MAREIIDVRPMFLSTLTAERGDRLIGDWITASLLFDQYYIVRSRPLLMLASAYLPTACMASSLHLAFPASLRPRVCLNRFWPKSKTGCRCSLLRGEQMKNKPQTVLVVDDDALNRKLLETLLRADGYEVSSVDSGAAALEAVISQAPGLVLLDAMMPGMDGFEVARRLKANQATSAIPLVMITALDDAASGTRLSAAGVEAVLNKPVDRWELKSVLIRILGAVTEP